MSQYPYSRIRTAIGLLLIALLSWQLVYLSTDPTPDISTSRGPFTDEGLNTSQARNFVNHGEWGMWQCDNLIKSPLYNGLLLIPFKTLGTHRWAGRLLTLLLSLALCGFAAWHSRSLYFAAPLLLSGLSYYSFQFQHFAMSEAIIAAASILLFYQWARVWQHPKLKSLLSLILLAHLIFWIKIQYFYLLAVPVLAVLQTFRQHPRMALQGFLLMLGLSGIFVLTWYIPNQELFELLREHQGSGRFARLEIWRDAADFSLKQLFLSKHNMGMSLSLLMAIAASLLLLPRLKPASFQKRLLGLSLLWLALESHKLLILYAPTRYYISSFAAMAFCVASAIWLWKQSGQPARHWVISLLLAPFITQLALNQRELWKQRSHKSAMVIEKLNRLDFKGRKVAGVWATALVWNETAIVLPVWKDFLNADLDPSSEDVEAIFIEEDEADSGGIWRSRNLDLLQIMPIRDSAHYGPYLVKWYRNN